MSDGMETAYTPINFKLQGDFSFIFTLTMMWAGRQHDMETIAKLTRANRY